MPKSLCKCRESGETRVRRFFGPKTKAAQGGTTSLPSRGGQAACQGGRGRAGGIRERGAVPPGPSHRPLPPPPGASSHPTPPPSRPAPHPPRAWDSDPGLAWAEGPAGLGGKGACARGSRASGRGDVPPTPAGFPSGSVPRRSAPRQLTPKKSP